MFQLCNYDSYFVCRDEDRGGGVVMYVLKTIVSVKIFELNFLENNFLLINLPILNINICAVCASSNKNEFLNKLDEILTTHKKMYVIGDFNLNLLNNKTNTMVQRYLDILNSAGFIPLNKVLPKYATRIATINNVTTNTVIDHISTDIFSVPYFLSVQDFFRSDHRVLILNIKMKNVPPQK